MTRRSQYIVGVSVITLVWFVLTIYLGSMSASIADTTDVRTSVPLWLKIASSVALFPLDLIMFLMSLTGIGGFNVPDRYYVPVGALFLFLVFANSLLWGFALVFLFRFLVRLGVVKKGKIKNAA